MKPGDKVRQKHGVQTTLEILAVDGLWAWVKTPDETHFTIEQSQLVHDIQKGDIVTSHAPGLQYVVHAIFKTNGAWYAALSRRNQSTAAPFVLPVGSLERVA